MSGLLPTHTILDKIVAQKLVEVKRLKASVRAESPYDLIGERAGHRFLERLRDQTLPGRPIIAEIKRASPSAGVLREPFEPGEIAGAYTENGARCISVITDEKFFQGSLAALAAARAATELPILCKDFIIDEAQVVEAARARADAVLLIARLLSYRRLKKLYNFARELGLAVLLEVHDEEDLERSLRLRPEPKLIGINNRDLSDFSVAVSRTTRLLPRMPAGVTVVSESGLSEPKVLDELLAQGVHAFLIGSSLMKAKDAGGALRRLVYE